MTIIVKSYSQPPEHDMQRDHILLSHILERSHQPTGHARTK